MKRLLRKADHDLFNRDRAIAIINGQIYENEAHAACINDYYDDNDLDDHYLPSERNRPTWKTVEPFIDKLAFAHVVEREKSIYLESLSIQNMTIEEAAEIIKVKYPDYSIYDDDVKESKMDFSTGQYVSNYVLIASSKRLVRKAEVEYNRFLEEILDLSNFRTGDIDEVISTNPDCAYNGKALRAFFFQNIEFQEFVEKFLEENNTTIDAIDIDQVVSYCVKNLIQVNGQYQSFTKSHSGLDTVISNLGSTVEPPIILLCSVQNGLDIELLVNKLGKNLDKETRFIYRQYQNEQEVVCKFEDTNYIIYNFNELAHVVETIQLELQQEIQLGA